MSARPRRAASPRAPAATTSTWSSYLAGFHEQRPGITEDVLGRSTSGALTPYEWIVAPVARTARTLDLACGSGPCLALRPSDPWVGVDRSSSELTRASSSASARVVMADATALPFAHDTFDGAVCSMALMLIQPIDEALEEMGRVLCEGATFVVLLPGRRPLRPRDLWRYARLVTRLGERRLHYPNDRALRPLRRLVATHGFRILDDQRRRFTFQLTSSSDTAKFVRSLYLPDVPESSIQRGERLAQRWIGSEIGIPLRRVTLRYDGTPCE